ncbi:MAG: hypothetical protein L3J63_13515 [Geopsychrobacter sp.]|nr:hypothetical protein [Geopsychrobacter sp.]
MEKKAFIIFPVLLLLFCSSFIAAAYGQSLVFGPEFYASDGGRSQRISKSFSVDDMGQDYSLSIQGGGSNKKSVGACIVELNGEIIASLNFGQQFKMLIKSVSLKKNNDISIELTGGAGATVVVTIMTMKEHVVTAKIPPIGQLVDLVEYASIVFPAGAFDSLQHISIYATATSNKAYTQGFRLPYEIRINTGNMAPEKDIEVDLNIPDSFYTSPYQIHIFARMFKHPEVKGEFERFVLLTSSVDEVIMTVRTTLPRQVFSTRFGRNGFYEAVMIVGLTH